MVFCCIWCRLTSTAGGRAFGQTMKHGNKVLRDKISLHQESWNAKDYDAVNYVALATCGWIKMNAKSKPKLPYLYLHSKTFSKMFYFFKRNNWNVFQMSNTQFILIRWHAPYQQRSFNRVAPILVLKWEKNAYLTRFMDFYFSKQQMIRA